MGKYIILKNENGERIVVEYAPKGQVSMFKVSEGILVEYTPTINKEDLKYITKDKKGRDENEISSYALADYYCDLIDLVNDQRRSQGEQEINKRIYNLIETMGIEDDKNLIERIDSRNESPEKIEYRETTKKFALTDRKTSMDIRYMACATIVFMIISAIFVSNLKFGFQEFIRMIEVYPKLSALISIIGTASVCELIKNPEKIRQIKTEIEIATERAYIYHQLAEELVNTDQKAQVVEPEKTAPAITEIKNKYTAYETSVLTIEGQEQDAQTRRKKIVITTRQPEESKTATSKRKEYLIAIKEALSEFEVEREYPNVISNFWGEQNPEQSEPQVSTEDKKFIYNGTSVLQKYPLVKKLGAKERRLYVTGVRK